MVSVLVSKEELASDGDGVLGKTEVTDSVEQESVLSDKDCVLELPKAEVGLFQKVYPHLLNSRGDGNSH